MLFIDFDEHSCFIINQHRVNRRCIDLPPVTGFNCWFSKVEIMSLGSLQNLTILHDTDGNEYSLCPVITIVQSNFVCFFTITRNKKCDLFRLIPIVLEQVFPIFGNSKLFNSFCLNRIRVSVFCCFRARVFKACIGICKCCSCIGFQISV